MKRIILLSLLLTGYLFAADNDLDGVDDAYDKCANTSFSDLVDANGCTIQSLQSNIHYDIILGGSYSQISYASAEKADTVTETFQADYYNGNFSAQMSGSYFQSSSSSNSENSFNDTIIAVYLKSPLENTFSIQTGIAVLLPTYSSGYHNEALDYQGSLSLHYNPNNIMGLFGGYSYTFVNDKDVPNTVLYQNTQAFYVGGSYNISDKAMMSTTYSQSQSIYVGTEAIKSASLGFSYQLDAHWFTMIDYRYGLSDSTSDHDISARIGYYF